MLIIILLRDDLPVHSQPTVDSVSNDNDGWVYATIAPDLWRLKDTNDDGVADVREVVAHGFGIHIAYGGHDMHGPMVGPNRSAIQLEIGMKIASATR